MFQGSIPPKMRAYVRQAVLEWGVSDLYVGCSGNFTIQRCIPEVKHHGNDVTLYSVAMGRWAAGQEMGITLKPDTDVEWLRPYTEDRDELLATILLGTRFLPSVGKDNDFHKRQVKAHRDQWEKIHAKTLETVRASTLRLESFHAKDVVEWMDEDVPADAAVAMYPPFFKGGYEVMWQALEDHFDWNPPVYPLLDEDGKDHLVEQITSRDHWLIGLHVPRPDLEPHLRSVIQTTAHGLPIYTYASDGPSGLSMPRQTTTFVPDKRLTRDIVLTGHEEVTLHPMTSQQFASLRSTYLTQHIKPGQPLLAFAVKLNGYLVGCFAYGAPNSAFDPHCVYLLSDFPVAPARYKRLAPLMSMFAQSEEPIALYQRSTSRLVDSIATTAFSNNPVSMKYRSAGLKLHSRKPGQDEWHEYQLQYTGPVPRWTMTEAYAEWFKKHSRFQEDQHETDA